MAEIRYRAFISYSHKDEAWAKWLHRALESYRVPKKLVGVRTCAGEVPARLRPVFRDREDLSSASDLNESVKQVLADSENLIVICSPDAAASRWVGEEIREFARLGRQSRIFCMIVNGEPGSNQPDKTCFQSALGDIGLSEPLAADVRSWADGKRLSLLKLISGMLGVRLDDLRQRDQKRRQKLMMITSLGVVAAMALLVMTIVSQVSSRLEREKAEQMATFIVDIGEKLQSDTDLETLAMISTEASRHFQDLDPEQLSPETGKKVALVLRQVARVSQLQGKPEDALDAYLKSRDILAMLREKHPETPGLLYELGVAQFYLGNLYLKQHNYVAARSATEQYHLSTRALLDTAPQNPAFIMERAYSHNNMAAVQLDSGMGVDDAILAHLAEAIRLMEKAMELTPFDETILSDYSNTLAYAADSQSKVCDLESAMSIREKVRALAETAVQSDPGNNDLKRRQAFAIAGVANLQIQQGRLNSSKHNLILTISILEELSAADPSNVRYRQLSLYQQILLARLIAENGRLDEAQSLMLALESEFTLERESTQSDNALLNDYIVFLLTYADLEARLGNREAASSHLQTAMQLQLNLSDSQALDRSDWVKLNMVRFQWWEIHGDDIQDSISMLSGTIPSSPGEFQSCAEADIAARMYVLEGDKGSAAKRVDYLRERGYADPSFVRFCKKHELCS